MRTRLLIQRGEPQAAPWNILASKSTLLLELLALLRLSGTDRASLSFSLIANRAKPAAMGEYVRSRKATSSATARLRSALRLEALIEGVDELDDLGVDRCELELELDGLLML